MRLALYYITKALAEGCHFPVLTQYFHTFLSDNSPLPCVQYLGRGAGHLGVVLAVSFRGNSF